MELVVARYQSRAQYWGTLVVLAEQSGPQSRGVRVSQSFRCLSLNPKLAENGM